MPHVIPTGENAAPLSVIGCTATEKVIIIMVGVSSTRAEVVGCVYKYGADYNVDQLTIVPYTLAWMTNSYLPQEKRMWLREYAAI
jgi:hypothetical protein